MTTPSFEETGTARGWRGTFASLRALLARLAQGRASVWGKPIARALLFAAGLAALAMVGRAIGAKTAAADVAPASHDGIALADAAAPVTLATAITTATPSEPPSTAAAPCSAETGAHAGGRAARNEATPDDPVILNTATLDDLRRLPGVGKKRAEAILALRARLGHFRQIEELLRVRGMGRATLRRLRPVVRLNAQSETAATGAANSATPPHP